MKKIHYSLLVLLLVCFLMIGGVNAWGKSVNVATLDYYANTFSSAASQESANPTCPVDGYSPAAGQTCPVENLPKETGTGVSFCSGDMGCVYPADYVQNFYSLNSVGVSAATLAKNDTLIMLGFNPSKLSAAQKTYINTWVNNGGKLIIWDTEDAYYSSLGHFDYTWMTHPFMSSGPGAMGASDYPLWIKENDQLSSIVTTSQYYIDNASISADTDAVGDSAIFAPSVAQDWCVNMESRNYLNMQGPTHVYSKVGKGVVIYSGLDWDSASYSGWSYTGGSQELKKVLRNELNASSLPCAVTWAGNLVVTKKTNKATYNVGETITFTVRVTNPATNTETSYNTTVTDRPPAQVTLAKRTWNLGTLAPGVSRQIQFTGKAKQSGTALVNTAGVTGNDTHWTTVFSGSGKAVFNIGTPKPLSGIGVFRPSTHTFYLKNRSATTTVNFGSYNDLPVSGDWNKDTRWDVGVFRPSTHTFYLKNGSKTTTVNFGSYNDLPVAGDWNGDSRWDVGVFRPSTHIFYLKNGSKTTTVNFGSYNDLPVAGDWNGDRKWDVGVFRPSTHTFYLKSGSATTTINFGGYGDLPVTGDWNGDGSWDVGTFRPSTHTFYLKNGSATTTVNWGSFNDLPVSGHWS
jgi:uncharacterized repeat protein (TIGR01451 family)